MKKKRKARDKREGLTFSARKRLTRLKRNLAGQGMAQEKPDTAQKTITFEKMYRDGTCQVTHSQKGETLDKLLFPCFLHCSCQESWRPLAAPSFCPPQFLRGSPPSSF